MLSGMSEAAIYTKEEKPSEKAMGIRKAMQPKKTMNRVATIIWLRPP